MKKFIFILIILFLIVACLYSITIDFATSIIPGWHTTIYPVWLIVLVFVVLFLMFYGLIYFSYVNFKKFLSKKRRNKIG